MTGDDALDRYRGKRDFGRTAEPSGSGGRSSGSGGSGGQPRFVIQAHDASSMHHDVRLEVDGVLKSWAVPKGPSTDPRDRRLAVPTEDHPLDYQDFEGTIPAGEYGGGAVLVWDAGTYENRSHDEDGEPVSMSEAIEAGHVSVDLHGEKLQGGYALTRTRRGEGAGGKGEAWILVKKKGEGADARRNPVSTQPESVLTGRTVAEVEADAEPDADGEDDSTS